MFWPTNLHSWGLWLLFLLVCGHFLNSKCVQFRCFLHWLWCVLDRPAMRTIHIQTAWGITKAGTSKSWHVTHTSVLLAALGLFVLASPANLFVFFSCSFATALSREWVLTCDACAVGFVLGAFCNRKQTLGFDHISSNLCRWCVSIQ